MNSGQITLTIPTKMVMYEAKARASYMGFQYTSVKHWYIKQQQTLSQTLWFRYHLYLKMQHLTTSSTIIHEYILGNTSIMISQFNHRTFLLLKIAQPSVPLPLNNRRYLLTLAGSGAFILVLWACLLIRAHIIVTQQAKAPVYKKQVTLSTAT